MKRLITLLVVAVITAASLTTGSIARADDDNEEPSISAPQRVFTDHGVTCVKLSADTQKAIDLQTKVLTSSFYQASLRAYGQVVELSDLLRSYRQLARVQARVSQSRARLNASQAEYQRLDGLYQHHQGASKKNVQRARALWQSDHASVGAATVQKFAANSEARARWGALITHWMLEHRRSFQQLAAGQSRLLKLTLPLGKAPQTPPRTVRILFANATTMTVLLVAPAPTTDPDLQGKSYYYLATSHLGQLNYGLHVIGLMHYGSQHSGVIVPNAAVVWLHGSAWVYLKTNDGCFVRKPARTRMPVPGGWFQAGGLRPGDRLVMQGVEVLLSVQALAAAPKGSAGEDDDED